MSFTLSEPGSVRFTIDRSASGRSVKGRVRQAVERQPQPAALQALARGEGLVHGHRQKGLNRIELRGRIGGRTLTPGRYRLNARETDRAANRSPTKRTAFRIVR